MNKVRPLNPTFGRQLFEIITAGMYSDPLMALREYIQNAADSIDVAVDTKVIEHHSATISITVDGRERSVCVEDNGQGIPIRYVEERLGGIGCSVKDGKSLRGFRGIGRLGGLSYCDSLRFETRAKGDKRVGVVEWDGRALRKAGTPADLKRLIGSIATLHFREAHVSEKAHFFRVTMLNVHRFHADALMNIAIIGRYISRVGPVPFNYDNFSFARRIEQHLDQIGGYRTYNIKLNGTPLFSPYTDAFTMSPNQQDRITDIEFIDFQTSEGIVFGRGWLANTSLLGAVPRSEPMHGISIRQGNIQICGDEFLTNFFMEPRFTGWHIGSFHLDGTLRPNARRDGFEETPNYERFLELLSVLARKLSKQCRKASKDRCMKQAVERELPNLRKYASTVLFIDNQHLEDLTSAIQKRLKSLEANSIYLSSKDFQNQLEKVREQISRMKAEAIFLADYLDGRSLNRIDPKEVLQIACRAVLKHVRQHDVVSKAMGEILEPYLKDDKERIHIAPISV